MAKKKKTKAKKATKKAAKPAKKKATKKAAGKKVAKKKATKKVATKKTKKKTAKKSVSKKSGGGSSGSKKISIVRKTPAPTPATPTAPTSPTGTDITTPTTPSTDTTPPTEFVGQPVPELDLPNQDGTPVSLAEMAQANPYLVLYFYPKDDTPGCTKEACDFRDNLNRLQANGVRVLGVSPDSGDSHKKFIEKYNLNFPLLTDTDKKLSEKLGVWKLKKYMGREYMGVERSTFLVKEGQIAKVWQPVSVEGHVDEILDTVDELKS
jgi:thioredoxin-dependent peroxiredoxin